MKTMKKSMLTAVMIMVSTFALANDNKPAVKIEKTGVKTFAVIAYGLNEGETEIAFRDQDGRILYSSTLKGGERYAKKLDLNNLPNGKYVLEVENKATFTATPLEVNAFTAIAQFDGQVSILKPLVHQKGGKLDVILPTEVQADVTIYDNNARKIATETVAGSSLKRFDLSRLEKGDYTVMVKTGGRNFIQSVSLD